MASDLGRSLSSSVISTKMGKLAMTETLYLSYYLWASKEVQSAYDRVTGELVITGYTSIASEAKFGLIFREHVDVIMYKSRLVIYLQLEKAPCWVPLVMLQLCVFQISLFRAAHFISGFWSHGPRILISYQKAKCVCGSLGDCKTIVVWFWFGLVWF